MKKLFVIFFLLLFFFCSKKEQSPYPHLNQPIADIYIKINTKEMIGVRPNVVGFNFTKDIKDKSYAFEPYDKVADVKKSKLKLAYGNWVVNKNYVPYSSVKYDSIVPRMDLKVIVDTTYAITKDNFEYRN